MASFLEGNKIWQDEDRRVSHGGKVYEFLVVGCGYCREGLRLWSFLEYPKTGAK